jgi:hypothetical protein
MSKTTIIAYGFLFNSDEKEIAEKIYRLGKADEDDDSNVTFTIEEQTPIPHSFDFKFSSIMDTDENENYYGEFLFLKQESFVTFDANLLESNLNYSNIPTHSEINICNNFYNWANSNNIIIPLPSMHLFTYHTRMR